MTDIIKDLYQLQVETEKFKNDCIDIGIRESIRQFLEQNKIHIITEESDRDKEDVAFALAEIGEEAGFVRGFQCAVQLFWECCKK